MSSYVESPAAALDTKKDGHTESGSSTHIHNTSPVSQRSDALTKRLRRWGVESRGISPVPLHERTDRHPYKLFFLWFSMNFNILSFSAGTLGPVAYGLGIRESCLVILFFNILCCLPPAYFCTWGPQTGMRQMVQARFSFGYYGVILPCVLNLIGMFGFCILNAILGGQTLASVAEGNLTWTAGIVIVVILSLALSFCGYSVLTWYERIAWLPVLLALLVALGLGGKNLKDVPPSDPADAAAVLSFAATIAGFVITYSPLASDFTIYFHPEVSSTKLFLYTYLGLFIPITSVQCLGASVAAAASFVPDWEAGYAQTNIGGLLEAMLSPAGNFGKFLTTMLSLSITGNLAATFYSIGLNIQVFVPVLVGFPRYVFSVVATAIVLPIAIVGSHRFYDTLENFLGLIGYWSSAFIAIILVEHIVIRKRQLIGHNHNLSSPSNYTNEAPTEHTSFATYYDLSTWNVPSRLPSGISAIAAGVASFGLVVPCMAQIWFVGPIAERTGDIGFEVAFALSAILYLGIRTVEIRLRRRKFESKY